MATIKVWISAVVVFALVATILFIQVSWLLQSARIEERSLNQRVNTALCRAMDVLSKDRELCAARESCVSRGSGKFEIAFTKQDKAKIDSVIGQQLSCNNIRAPFQTKFTPYAGDTTASSLLLSQALLYPAKAGMQNVLVHIDIPSKEQLVRAQINGAFILSVIVLIALIGIFISTARALIREKKIRKETVDFINTMAHDLKTPISNISFAVSLLNRDQQNANGGNNPFVSVIETEAARLKERARKILGVASVDAVIENISEQDNIDVHELLDEAAGAFRLKLDEAKGSVRKHFNAVRSVVKGNRLQLSSAVMNILDNAVTYSQSAVEIHINTFNDGDGIRIEIKDNGPGIPWREQALVFKKAYRARHNNGGKLPEGFGLGLYLAKTTVEKNGGRISLSSNGVAGSCFVIQLPLLK